ncbi:MAG: hypothetical protein JRG89_09265 [Deltaproteobacteria bacterium]|nr:hypothetical protein [Deltaproteobacteria bacterium]MBW2723536.1 hypothetical protein [Deltaproteobacteria bacterium]
MDEAKSGVVHSPPPSGLKAVGVDLGATLAKLAIRAPSGELHFESMPAHETERLARRITSLAPEQIGLTGCGAAGFAERLDVPSRRYDEFSSWGAGTRKLVDAEALSGDSRNLLVSLGTGTSVLLMDGDSTVRIGGTALGGGTVVGLASALLGTTDFKEICQLAQRGNRSRVDLVVSDIYRSGEIGLPADLTAASFGKLGLVDGTPGGKEPENLAAAILGLVGENVGLICAGLSYASQVERIIFAGSTLHENRVLCDILSSITTNMGRTPLFLPDGEYGGATGALILSDRES